MQWVAVVQKICPTDGLWVSWPAQLVRISILPYFSSQCRVFACIFTRLANTRHGHQYHLILDECLGRRVLAYSRVSSTQGTRCFTRAYPATIHPAYHFLLGSISVRAISTNHVSKALPGDMSNNSVCPLYCQNPSTRWYPGTRSCTVETRGGAINRPVNRVPWKILRSKSQQAGCPLFTRITAWRIQLALSYRVA